MNASAIELEHVDLLPEGAQLLNEVQAFLKRFVAYPSLHAAIAHTLWIAHTHAMDCWESTPRAAFLSPEPGSGKTRALEVTELLVPRPCETVNATPAYVFRKVSDPEGRPTLLWDEIDTLFGAKAREHEEVRGLLNAGHRRGAMAGRCAVKGKTVVTEELPAYCAVALAGLGNLPDTIFTRSVCIRMRRRAPTENVEPFRRRIHAPEGNALRDRLARWTEQSAAQLTGRWPTMPEGVSDRAADVWEPLLAIADVAGGDWPKLARETAVTLVTQSAETPLSLGVRLLADLRQVFGENLNMFTADVLGLLNSLEDAPWADLKGAPLDSRRLAALLRKYEVRSTTVRVGAIVGKGYRREDLHDVWSRYLQSPTAVTSVTCTPPLPPTSQALHTGGSAVGVTSVTSVACTRCDDESAAGPQDGAPPALARGALNPPSSSDSIRPPMTSTQK